MSRLRAPRPRHLVVVGAAAGMGRWLSDHVLRHAHWESVCLVDVPDSLAALREAAQLYAAQPDSADPGTAVPRVRVAVPPGEAGQDAAFVDESGEPVPAGASGTVVVLALPHAVLPGAVRRIVPLLHEDAALAVVAHGLVRALGVLAELAGGHAAYGVHPLFDVAARGLEGQTVYLAPAPDPHANTHVWLVELLRSLGGTLRFGTAARHDESMAFVQALAHQALVGFAGAVVESGLDLHDDVWAARTPMFETLFGLAVRALDESQQQTLAGIQTSLDGPRAAAALAASAQLLRAAVDAGETEAVAARMSQIRDRFSGALFDTVRGTAAAAVVAAQSKRAELARHMRSGELVGIRSIGRADSLRVGRIVDVDPVEVTLQEVLVGRQGRAALLDGPGRHNAPRLGLGGKPRQTVFSLGHVELVTGAELDRELDTWLAHLRRDVRFLVPESVAGSGVLQVVAPMPGIRDSAVVSEVVRTGQRSVVVRVQVRVDRDVEETVEVLRSLVQRAFAWPRGLSLPLVGDHREVTYLGPAGTFSEVAAAHLAADVGMIEAQLVPAESFDAVLAAVASGGIGVLPISSSASGLVSRAAAALLGHDGELLAGGVIDVAVRFDAFVRADAHLDGLRHAPVYSHPQALAQCRSFIRRWELEPVVCPSTADALRRVADRPGPAVALAGEGRGEPLGLKVAEREVDDLSGSITRFVILGRPGSFGDLVGGSDPTLRSIYLAASLSAVTGSMSTSAVGSGMPPPVGPQGGGGGAGHPAYDEVLSDAVGRCLWVTSRESVPGTAGLRSLGRAPWTPRTPLVRVEG